MIDLYVAWPIIGASAFVVFGAGSLVEKMRNGKYVKKELCAAYRSNEAERWTAITKTLEEIKADVKALGNRE